MPLLLLNNLPSGNKSILPEVVKSVIILVLQPSYDCFRVIFKGGLDLVVFLQRDGKINFSLSIFESSKGSSVFNLGNKFDEVFFFR